jgi:hypothetical protein
VFVYGCVSVQFCHVVVVAGKLESHRAPAKVNTEKEKKLF